MITLLLDGTDINFYNELLTVQPNAEALMDWTKRNRDSLSDKKGVYIISTSDDKTIYIGKAKDLYKRTMEHCKEMLPDLCTEAKRKKVKKAGMQKYLFCVTRRPMRYLISKQIW